MRHSLYAVESPGVPLSSNAYYHTNVSPQFRTTMSDADLDCLFAKVPTDGSSIANPSLLAALGVEGNVEWNTAHGWLLSNKALSIG